MNYVRSLVLYTALAFGLVLLLMVPGMASASSGGFIGPLTHIDQIASTVPQNGDINPYGVAVVHRSMGALIQGDVLVSNFNNSTNKQGTGTTIVEVAPDGHLLLFAHIRSGDVSGSCPGGVGLTTALVALRSGWVIVGSLPTRDGTAATAKAGCLIVLNSLGHVVETFSGGSINGPWDMTAAEGNNWAALFVANVLNGTVAANGKTVNRGTVVRINLSVPDDGSGKPYSRLPREVSRTVIGSQFGEKSDPAALVIGPTGLGLAGDGTLYVADTLANRIAAIPNALSRSSSAGTGRTVSQGGALNGPLGLTIAPNGDILAANAGDGNMVEITPGGAQVATKMVDATNTGAGTLFGLDIAPNGKGVYFVNDGNNALYLLH